MRILIPVLLLASIAQAQPVYFGADGGVLAIDVERAVILLPRTDPDAGDVVLRVDGGTWVSTDERLREGQQHADLVSRNVYLESHASDFPTLWIGIGVGAGFLVGAILAGATVAALKK